MILADGPCSSLSDVFESEHSQSLAGSVRKLRRDDRLSVHALPSQAVDIVLAPDSSNKL